MDEDAQERQLNIHLDPENLAGVYANFANISFSDYEFTLYDLSQPNPPGWSYVWIDDHPTVVQRIAMARAWRSTER